jgi:hypothetical protein
LKNKDKMCDNNGDNYSDNEANDLTSTSSEVADIAEKVVVDLVPQKSRQQYELVYNKFKQ